MPHHLVCVEKFTKAGQLQLLSEDLVLLLRNAGWGGRKSCHERRRRALRERRRWELDDGDDGCVGEHYGVGGFDHLPEDDFLYGERGRRLLRKPVSYTHLTLPTTPYV